MSRLLGALVMNLWPMLCPCFCFSCFKYPIVMHLTAPSNISGANHFFVCPALWSPMCNKWAWHPGKGRVPGGNSGLVQPLLQPHGWAIGWYHPTLLTSPACVSWAISAEIPALLQPGLWGLQMGTWGSWISWRIPQCQSAGFAVNALRVAALRFPKL